MKTELRLLISEFHLLLANLCFLVLKKKKKKPSRGPEDFLDIKSFLHKQHIDELSVNESETYWVSDSKIHTPSHAIQKKEAQRSAMFVSSLKEASF